MRKENEEKREALRTALILWEQGGQELLERVINSEKEEKRRNHEQIKS